MGKNCKTVFESLAQICVQLVHLQGGPPRRPFTPEEARKGALQEWSKLMTEPSHKWSNPLITPYSDEFGRPRGTMNFEVACNAPPDSNLRAIALAYMGSPDSGYSIAYWSSPNEGQWLTTSSFQVGDRIIERQGRAWNVTRFYWRSRFHLWWEA